MVKSGRWVGVARSRDDDVVKSTASQIRQGRGARNIDSLLAPVGIGIVLEDREVRGRLRLRRFRPGGRRHSQGCVRGRAGS